MLTIETLTHDKIKKFFNQLLITPIRIPERKKANKIYNGNVARCYGTGTISKYYSLLRELCQDFSFIHNFPLGNRFEKQDTYQAWNPREQRISVEDEQKIYDACDTRREADQFRQLFKLGINTGMRASELLRLKASNCFLADDKRYIYIASDTNKMKSSRSVPLSLIARQVLIDNFATKTKEEIDNGIRVFDKLRTYSLDSMIKKITFASGNPNIRLGDCRHEFLCRTLEQTDIDVVKLSLATGHNLKTLIKYANQFRPLVTAIALDQKK
jgi:integrase